MATLLKIRGLDRGSTQAPGGGAAGTRMVGSGFRLRSGVFPNSVTGGTAVKASRTIGATTSAVTYTARVGGVAGNSITVAQVAAGANTPFSIVVTYAAGTGLPTITVNLATTAVAGTIDAANTANQANSVAAAVNSHPEANQFVSVAGGGTGVAIAGAGAVLAGGANGTGTTEPFYQVVNSKTNVVVDVDDSATLRMLQRNKARYISLGTP